MADGSHLFAFAGVKLKRKKVWVEGEVTVQREGPGHAFALSFVPSDSAFGSAAFTAPGADVAAVQHGEKDGVALLRVEMRDGKKRFFDFGSRVAATIKVEELMNTTAPANGTPAAAAPAPSPAAAAPAKNGGGAGGSSSSSSNAYFDTYGRPEETEDVPEPGGATPMERAVRKSMLESDVELCELYRAVVVPGIMGEEEFWAARKELVQEELADKSQKHGLLTGMTADLHASTNQASATYSVTAEQMQRIFLDQPKVKAIYDAKVRSKELDDLKFWTLYLSSKYHYQGELTAEYLASEEAREAAALFGGFDDEDDEDDDDGTVAGAARVVSLASRGSRPRGVQVDPNVDLLATLNDDPHGAPTTLAAVGMASRAGYGIVDRDPLEAKKDKVNREKLRNMGRKVTMEAVEKLENKPLTSGPLMSRYNRHAAVVLPNERGNPQRAKRRIDRMRKMEEEAEVLEDLQPEGGDAGKARPVAFDLADTTAYLAVGGTRAAAAGSAAPATAGAVAGDGAGLLKCSMRDLGSVVPRQSVALSVLRHVLGEAQAGAGGIGRDVEDLEDAPELLRLHRISNELRSHFWRSFPPTKAKAKALSEVVEKLRACLGRMRSFRIYVRDNSNLDVATLLLDMISQVEKATNDYDRFTQMQQRKRQKTAATS